MGNVPVIHEVKTSFESLGDALKGDMEGASRRWGEYSEASVIGSGIRAAIAASGGNMPESERLGIAMGRATCRALLEVGDVAATAATGGAKSPLGAVIAAAAGN